METFSALLAICAGNSPVTGKFPTQRPVTRSFDVFFDLRLNKRLSKQSWGWWFETLSCPLWRHRNAIGVSRIVDEIKMSGCDHQISDSSLRSRLAKTRITWLHGNVFRITGHLCKKSTCHRCFSLTKDQRCGTFISTCASIWDTVDIPVIWDSMELMWRHCNDAIQISIMRRWWFYLWKRTMKKEVFVPSGHTTQ